MRHYLALPVCALTLWLASVPALPAGPDRTAAVSTRVARLHTLKSAFFLRPPPPLPRLRHLAQAQGQPGQEEAPPSGPKVPDEAIKAEMEKRWGDAERIYRDILSQQPDRVDLQLRLVDVLAAAGKKQEAAQALARAADLRPDDADLQLHASEAFAAVEKPADALRYVDRALRLRPNDLDVHQRRAQLSVWAGDYTQAVESLKVLGQANPNDAKLKRDLAQVLVWHGHSDEAAKVLSDFVAQHPDKDALLDLAHIQSANGDTDAAEQTLQRFREAGGDEETYKQELAKVQSDINAPIKAENEKRYADAERMYRAILAHDPGRADVLARLGDLLAVEGKPLDAAQAIAQAADQKADDADLQVKASEGFAAAAKPEDALRYLDKAIALRPADEVLQQHRAQLLTWLGKYAEAEQTLKKLVAANPGNADFKRDLGRVLMYEHKLPEAAAMLSQYLEAHPEDKEGLLDLARVEAARHNTKATGELLQRYRTAGGDEQTFKQELAKEIGAPKGPPGPVRRPAAARAPRGVAAGGPSPAGPAPPVPPEVIKAEQAKRYGEAARLIRGLLAAQPNRVDLWVRLSQVYAADKKGLLAAQALGKAADLAPANGKLQLQASEAYGAVDRPAEALRYVDRALAVSPNDLALHKRRVQVANWAGQYAEAEESLRFMIAANPGDLTLQRDLARVLNWEGHIQEAAAMFEAYLAQQPTDPEALIELARIRIGQGDFDTGLALLERYRAAGGEELTYQHELSLMLAWGGRPYGALTIAEAGLARDPNDFTFHFARSVALNNGYETGLALQEADRLAQLRPNAPELVGLRRILDIAQRPYMQLDLGGHWESDNVSTQLVDLSYHQPIADGWWAFVGGHSDFTQAVRGSQFAPVGGGTTTDLGGGYVGAQARLSFATLGTLRVGGSQTTNGRTTPTYQAAIDSRVSDELRVQLSNVRDFYPISPRSLSRGVTRMDSTAQLTFTPDLAWTVGLIAQEGELSHDNHGWRVYLAPRRAIIRTEDWNVDLGVTGNWYGYSRKPILDGYYSPSLYQYYAGTAYIYYKLSDESGLALNIAYGVNRDETIPSYKFTQDYTAEATFGALSEWMLKLRAAYTNHGANGPGFSAESVGMTLVKRF